MASPYLLGASSGAAFGAALGLFLGFNLFIVQILAFIFGNIAVIIALFIGKSSTDRTGVSLILAGMIIGSLFSALLSLLKLFADPIVRLPGIVYWLMGSMANLSNQDILITIPFFVIGQVVLYVLSWKLNILSLGDEEAKRLGENPKILRMIIIFAATLLTTVSVSLCGIIGWVGLVIPHIGRMIIGPNFKKLIPFSMVAGAAYLLIIDDLCRSLLPQEIPIGIMTALIGAPLFGWLLAKRHSQWS